jgi:hypothetical protein
MAFPGRKRRHPGWVMAFGGPERRHPGWVMAFGGPERRHPGWVMAFGGPERRIPGWVMAFPVRKRRYSLTATRLARSPDLRKDLCSQDAGDARGEPRDRGGRPGAGPVSSGLARLGARRAGRTAASIFKAADYGLVGDVLQVVPALVERLKR